MTLHVLKMFNLKATDDPTMVVLALLLDQDVQKQSHSFCAKLYGQLFTLAEKRWLTKASSRDVKCTAPDRTMFDLMLRRIGLHESEGQFPNAYRCLLWAMFMAYCPDNDCTCGHMDSLRCVPDESGEWPFVKRYKQMVLNYRPDEDVDSDGKYIRDKVDLSGAEEGSVLHQSTFKHPRKDILRSDLEADEFMALYRRITEKLLKQFDTDPNNPHLKPTMPLRFPESSIDSYITEVVAVAEKLEPSPWDSYLDKQRALHAQDEWKFGVLDAVNRMFRLRKLPVHDVVVRGDTLMLTLRIKGTNQHADRCKVRVAPQSVIVLGAGGWGDVGAAIQFAAPCFFQPYLTRWTVSSHNICINLKMDRAYKKLAEQLAGSVCLEMDCTAVERENNTQGVERIGSEGVLIPLPELPKEQQVEIDLTPYRQRPETEPATGNQPNVTVPPKTPEIGSVSGSTARLGSGDKSCVTNLTSSRTATDTPTATVLNTAKTLASTATEVAASQAAASPSTTTSSAHLYPTSSRKGPRNWDKVRLEDDDDDDDDDPSKSSNPDDFFKMLYKNLNDDQRRAMVKSFTESGGTALSTDWDDVGKRTVPVNPPEGVEARKWGQ